MEAGKLCVFETFVKSHISNNQVLGIVFTFLCVVGSGFLFDEVFWDVQFPTTGPSPNLNNEYATAYNHEKYTGPLILERSVDACVPNKAWS